MKSFLRILAVFLILVSSIGCSKKTMDPATFLLTRNNLSATDLISFYVGSEEIFDFSIPIAEAQLSAFGSDNLTVEYTNDQLILHADEPGSYILVCNVSAKGYEPLSISIPVDVKLLPLSLELEPSEPDDSYKNGSPLTIQRGKEAVLNILTDPEAEISIAGHDETIANITIEDGQLLIFALYPGQTSVAVEVFKPNHESAVFTLPIVIEPTSASLLIEQENLFLTRGLRTQTALSYQEGGTLSLSYDQSAITIDQQNGTLSISALKTGNHPVTVTCQADGYLDSSAKFTVNVAKPSVLLNVDTSAISLDVGSSKQLAVSAEPSDAAITITTSSGLTVTNQGGTLILEGKTVGNYTLKISASKDDYETATKSISVTVSSKAPSNILTTTAQRMIEYTNQARTAAGLAPLTHLSILDAPSATRAQEASRYWSHTRPDGRSCDTVLMDYGISFRGRGENLFANSILDSKAYFDDLMDSPSHRENILRPSYTGIGISIVMGSDGDYYGAMIFIHD